MSNKFNNEKSLLFSILLIFLFMAFYYLLIAINPELDFSASNALEYSSTRISDFHERNSSLISFGMEGESLTNETARKMGLLEPVGFLVTNVFPSSNADRAGIQEGDVILEINDNYIKNKSDLESQMRLKNNEFVKLTIIRYGTTLDLFMDLVLHKVQQSKIQLESYRNPKLLNFSTYHGLDFSMEYPSGWEVNSGNDLHPSVANQVYFRSLSENASDIREYVRVSVYYGTNISEFIKVDIPEVYNITENTTDNTRNGYKTNMISFKYNSTEEKIGLKAKKFVISMNSNVYVLLYYADEKKFDSYLETVEKMIDTFKIHKIKIYENLEQGVRFRYAEDIWQPIDKDIWQPIDNLDSIEFQLKNRSDEVFPKFTIRKYDPFMDTINQSDLLSSKPYVNFSITSNDTGIYHNGQLFNNTEYHYYDPVLGIINGKSYFTEFEGQNYIITYEAEKKLFEQVLPLVESMINSMDFFSLVPYKNDNMYLFLKFPSYWKIIDKASDFVKLNTDNFRDSSFGINLQIAMIHDNGTDRLNDLFTNVLNDKKKSGLVAKLVPTSDPSSFLNASHGIQYQIDNFSNVNNIISNSTLRNEVQIKSLESYYYHDGRLYNISFSAKSSDFNYSWPMAQDIISSELEIFDLLKQTSIGDKFDGKIEHPFEINYNSSGWKWTEDVKGYLGKTVTFQPRNSNDTTLSISYWNENDFPISGQESYDISTYSDPSVAPFSISNTSNPDLRSTTLTGKSVLYYYSYPDNFVNRIFYGRSDNLSNYAISFNSPVEEYFKYLPTVDKMIESIKIKHPVSEIEPKGILVGKNPTGIIFAKIKANEQETSIIIVANNLDDSISIINASNLNLINKVPVEKGPFDLAFNNNSVYVIHNNGSDPASPLNYGSITEITSPLSPSPETKTIYQSKDIFPVDVVVSQSNKIFIGDPKSNKIDIIDGNNSSIIANVTLGPYPYNYYPPGMGLALDEGNNILYVANPNMKEVQLIDLTSNKLSYNLSLPNNDIACPVDIAVDSAIGKAYLVDLNNNCDPYSNNKGRLLVINTELGNLEDKTIPLGKSPNNVAVDTSTHKVYVTNQLSDSITIIDPFMYKTNDIEDIGSSPFGVAIDPATGLIFVTSSLSDSVTAIDEKTNKIVHKVTFDTNMPNGGRIKCNNNDYLLGHLYQISDESVCIAEPNEGFAFSSWESKSGINLHKMLNSGTRPSIFDSVVNKVLGSLGLASGSGSMKALTSGDFTVNFIPYQSIIPKDQLIGLYTLAVTLFTGWLVPNVTRWIYTGRKTKNQIKTFANYLKNLEDMSTLINKMNHREQLNVEPLVGVNDIIKDIKEFRTNTADSLYEGMLTEGQYSTLDRKISELESKYNSKLP